MMENEGEFKKREDARLTVVERKIGKRQSKYENGWQNGWHEVSGFHNKDLEDAKKEIFQNIKLVASDKFHGFVIENDEKMIETLKKWFGSAENKR